MEALVTGVYRSLAGLGTETKAEPAPPPKRKTSVVSVKASVQDDYLVCLECGQKVKTLKRHLRAVHHMTPVSYRAEFRLPFDYPVVAPGYTKKRSELAVTHGLGRKLGEKARARKKSKGQGKA